MYRDSANQLLPVQVTSTGGDGFRDNLLFAVADDWRRAGLDSDPVIIPRQRVNDREYRMTRPGFEIVGRSVDLTGLTRFHSREIPTAQNAFIGNNRVRYSNPDLDALIDRYNITIERSERSAILGHIVHHLTDRLVVMDLYFGAEPFAYDRRLKNVHLATPWNVHEWELQG
jgi:hypothetical protein